MTRAAQPGGPRVGKAARGLLGPPSPRRPSPPCHSVHRPHACPWRRARSQLEPGGSTPRPNTALAWAAFPVADTYIHTYIHTQLPDPGPARGEALPIRAGHMHNTTPLRAC
jgi:hypothetical protein